MKQREFKFRAWDKRDWNAENHKMIYNCFDAIYNTKGYVLFQYAGLKDKNGIEIYEGDIVKARSIIDESRNLNYSPYIISFNNGTFCFTKHSSPDPITQWKDGNNDWTSLENIEGYEMEVIGNIYENTIIKYNINIFKSVKDTYTIIVDYPKKNSNNIIRDEDIRLFAISMNQLEEEEEQYITSIEPRF